MENRNFSVVKSKWQLWLPHLLVMAWLFYLGITIWQHAVHSLQPPLYDPLSYMQKAMNFWHSIEQGKFVNPLDLEPSVRPPGTIMVSYPFGFSRDFHWYHFRSVFFPLLCIVAALYIATGISQAKAGGWWIAAIAFLLSSLPMFYHFDLSEAIYGPGSWGMVDNFQAGIAAIATAALVRSLLERSQPWLLFCAMLASFTLLIKPSGLMVMALIALIWLIVIVIEWRWSLRSGLLDSSLRSYVFKGGASFSIIYLVVFTPCLFSSYLSGTNFKFAKQVLTVVRETYRIPFQQTLLWFHQSSGEALLLWVIVAGVLFVYRLLIARGNRELLSVRIFGLLVGSLLFWSLGAWYWLVVQAGIAIRYFYPFMLMGIVCIIPAVLHVCLHSNRVIRIMLMVICCLPALNVAGLLAAGDKPSISWQKMAGVNISVGEDREEIGQAYAFLSEVRKEAKKDVQIYSFSSGVLPQIFENVGTYERIIRPDQPSFKAVIPTDWVRGFAVRVSELTESDYILIRKHPDLNTGIFLTAAKFDSFSSETTAFEVWLANLNESSGIRIISDGKVLRVLRIVDRTALRRSVDLFVSAHAWRPEFSAANRPGWWNAAAVTTYASNPAAKDIIFGHIYRLHALAISRINNGVKIEIWWDETQREEANNQRYLFLHLVDAAGNILYNQQVALYPYQPPAENLSWRYGTVTFSEALSNKNVTSLAFGVYQPTDPTGGFLVGDKGLTDWGGKRILIPLDSVIASKRSL